MKRFLPSRTRIAELEFSVMIRAAVRIAMSPLQNTGGRPISSSTLIVPSSGSACTVCPARVSRSRRVTATHPAPAGLPSTAIACSRAIR